MSDGVIFTNDEAARIEAATLAHERKPQYTLQPRKLRRVYDEGSGTAGNNNGSNGTCACAFIASGSITDPGGVTGNFANRYTIVGGVSSEFGTDDIDMDYDTGANWLSGAITFTC